jgi:UDP-3-O-[3-hydroxymyristoyl] glucosamine N-acyltransferase
MFELNANQILAKIGQGELYNISNPEMIKVSKVKNLQEADENSISILSSKSHLKEAKLSNAKLFLTNTELSKLIDKPSIIVEEPEIILGKILEIFYPPKKSNGKISELSFIDSSAILEENVQIGNFVSIGKNSFIGKNSILEDGVKIAENVRIGENARIGMNSVFHEGTEVGKNFIVYGNSTFGADGFKFINTKDKHIKIPQIGKVIIGDDVEIGANCTIDRGGLENTIIGSGTKFDNMVHIGHNTKIGKNVIIAGQSGVAGSTVIEDGVLIGGGCCISDHLYLKEGTVVAGGTGLRTSPKEPGVVIGWDWGMNFSEFQKARVNIKHLINFNKIISRIKELEKKLGLNSTE